MKTKLNETVLLEGNTLLKETNASFSYGIHPARAADPKQKSLIQFKQSVVNQHHISVNMSSHLSHLNTSTSLKLAILVLKLKLCSVDSSQKLILSRNPCTYLSCWIQNLKSNNLKKSTLQNRPIHPFATSVFILFRVAWGWSLSQVLKDERHHRRPVWN